MRLGHLAFSQTVSRCRSFKRLAVKWLELPLGTLRLSQRGRRCVRSVLVGLGETATTGRGFEINGRSSGFTLFGSLRQLRQEGMAGVEVIALQHQGFGHVRDERG